MSRTDRLKKEYSNPLHGQRDGKYFGSASDKQNLAEFSARATANSQLAPRAKGPVHGGPPGTHGMDAPKLPSTGEVKLRSTAAKPKIAHRLDRLMAGTDPGDKNTAGGSSYMRGIRREA